MNKPKISIVVPVYNVERYLKECLDSVLAQEFLDFEVICVNDGSTDGSQDILDSYCAKDQRVRVICQKNAGLSGARNSGIKYACGKYICFLDSDDMLVPNALLNMFQVAEEQEAEVLSFEMAYLIYESDELKKKDYKDDYYSKKHKYSGVETGKNYFVQMMEHNEFITAAWLLMVNRKWLSEKKIIFYPGIFYEDVLFVFQCFFESKRMLHVKQKNYIYRVRENSIMTSDVDYKKVFSYLLIYKELYRLLQNEEDEQVKKQIIRYANVTAKNIRWLDMQASEQIKEQYNELPCEEQFYANCLDIGQHNPPLNDQVYLEGFTSMLKEQPRVVLYGAGKVGSITYQYLQKIGADEQVECFAVTGEVEDDRLLMGVPICSIYNLLEDKKEVLILITVGKNYQQEIRNLLRQLGFENVAVIDSILEAGMERK